MTKMDDREKLSFWIDRELADSVRQKMLDHKRATRERITITDICTDALQKFINPKEGNEMKNTYESNYQAKTVTGIEVTMPDSFDLKADFESPRSYTAIRKGIWGNPDRKVRVKADHEATGTGTTGTGDTVVKIC